MARPRPLLMAANVARNAVIEVRRYGDLERVLEATDLLTAAISGQAEDFRIPPNPDYLCGPVAQRVGAYPRAPVQIKHRPRVGRVDRPIA